jgi:hypothetical protein
MNDGGGCGQRLMMRGKIYFRGDTEHSPKYPVFYPDIQAGLFRSITPNPSAHGISAIPHRTLPSRRDARLLPVRGPCGPPARGLRIGEGRRMSAPLHAAPAEQGRRVINSDELQDALILVRPRRRQVGGRRLSLESMWIVSPNSCHLLPKPLKLCESRPISGQESWSPDRTSTEAFEGDFSPAASFL